MQQLVKTARRILAAYTDVAVPLFNTLTDNDQKSQAVITATRLFVSSAMTTDAIIILIEHGLIWDALALSRTLLEGTARFCFLLSAPSEEEEEKRCREFEELLADKAMGGLEQRVDNLHKSHLYKHDKTDEYLDRIMASVEEAVQTKNEEASIAKRRWRFLDLSSLLRRECPEWNSMADMWEFRYSTANFAIHKETLAIVSADVGNWRQKWGPDTLEVKAWGPSLLSFCIQLTHDRLSVFMRKQHLNNEILLNPLQQAIVFAKLASEAEMVWSEKLRKAYSCEA